MTDGDAKPTQEKVTPTAAGLAIVYRRIDDLRLEPKNPRLHSPKQIGQIAASIEAFGFNVPILIDSKNKVVAGHGRVLACKRLKWTEVPTICLDRAVFQAGIRDCMEGDDTAANKHYLEAKNLLSGDQKEVRRP